jgi:hypothetical protein
VADRVCPLLHEPTAESGWEVTGWVTHNGRPLHYHLVPCCDLRRHQLDPICWCNPQEDEDAAGFWIHNSADGREHFETGQRAPS